MRTRESLARTPLLERMHLYIALVQEDIVTSRILEIYRLELASTHQREFTRTSVSLAKRPRRLLYFRKHVVGPESRSWILATNKVSWVPSVRERTLAAFLLVRLTVGSLVRIRTQRTSDSYVTVIERCSLTGMRRALVARYLRWENRLFDSTMSSMSV